MVCQPQTTSPDQSKDNHAVRILTCGRLRRVPHGLYQCCSKLHSILQPPTRRQQRHRDRLRDFPDRPNGRRVVQLGFRLAWPSLAHLHWVPGDMHWRNRHSSCSDDFCVHRRTLHVVVLFDDRNGCCSDVSDRDCAAAASWDCGWFVQYAILFGENA
jgi:hypothetical protein